MRGGKEEEEEDAGMGRAECDGKRGGCGECEECEECGGERERCGECEECGRCGDGMRGMQRMS